MNEIAFRELSSLIDVGIIVQDATHRVVYANPAASELLSVPPEKLIGSRLIDLEISAIGVDGQALTPAALPPHLALSEKRPVRGFVMGIGSGEKEELTWLLVHSKPLFEDEGEVHLVVTSFSDVSSEHRHILEADGLYRSVIHSMHEGIVLHGPDGAILTCNPSAESILGVSLAEMQGLTPLDPRWGLIRPDGSPFPSSEAPSELARLSGRAVPPTRIGVRKSNGDITWLEVSARPVATPGTKGSRVLATLSDVTLAVMRERELERNQEQLRQIQKREGMGDLAAGMAHNFNNMLAVILPNLEAALEHTTQGDENHELLLDSLDAARSAAALVHQLLVAARREANPEENCDLVPIVEGSVAICLRTFDRRIQIDPRLSVRKAIVLGRAADLQQVVLNLCLNARDALSKRPDPRITVELELDAGQVVLRISDNGQGMSEETQRHMGELFFTTKGPAKGTGLGLATVYGIVQKAGGEVRCETRLHEGTTFTVRLPVQAASTETIPPPQSSKHAPNLSGKTLMVVDDEPLVRVALARQLRALGARVVVAHDGHDALGLVDSILPDAVLMDLSMPGMSGLELLEILRARFPDLPIAVVSGYVPKKPALATMVLEKPVPLPALFEFLTVAFEAAA